MNIKKDLIETIQTEKYLLECDLIDVYDNKVIVYSRKLIKIRNLIKKINNLNNELELIEVYMISSDSSNKKNKK